MAPDSTNAAIVRQACPVLELVPEIDEKISEHNIGDTGTKSELIATDEITPQEVFNVQEELNSLLSEIQKISEDLEEESTDSNMNVRQRKLGVEDGKVVEDVVKDASVNSVVKEPFVAQWRWPDLLVQIFLHVGFLYGFYLMLTTAKIYTSIFAMVTVYTTGFGITAGAHRLWSHRAYKAKWPLRLLLITLFTVTGQRDVYTWALDHRVHHKYSETDSDPHDARRGFLFSHVGWLVLTPHPDVVTKRKIIDMSDLEADPIVMWQKTLYIPLFALLNIVLPVLFPVWMWNETLWVSFWVMFNYRFTFTLNIAFFVNSVAHMWGQKPYDKNISPVENLAVAIAALGEGWHNYHHVFPWDYKTAELGDYTFNVSTAFIDFFAKIGWAYDRKSVSGDMIARRAVKHGDGSYVIDHHNPDITPVWGYGDIDIPKEDALELESMEDTPKA